jgi:hypothetical protein
MRFTNAEVLGVVSAVVAGVAWALVFYAAARP